MEFNLRIKPSRGNNYLKAGRKLGCKNETSSRLSRFRFKILHLFFHYFDSIGFDPCGVTEACYQNHKRKSPTATATPTHFHHLRSNAPTPITHTHRKTRMITVMTQRNDEE